MYEKLRKSLKNSEIIYSGVEFRNLRGKKWNALNFFISQNYYTGVRKMLKLLLFDNIWLRVITLSILHSSIKVLEIIVNLVGVMLL